MYKNEISINKLKYNKVLTLDNTFPWRKDSVLNVVFKCYIMCILFLGTEFLTLLILCFLFYFKKSNQSEILTVFKMKMVFGILVRVS